MRVMAKLGQFGDRRCTLEGAELLVGIYRRAYSRHEAELSNGHIRPMPPEMTRVKAEIEETHALIESAKQKGASAWDRMKDGVQAALDQLTSSYQEAIVHGMK